MNKKIAIGVIALVIIGIAGWYLYTTNQKTEVAQTENNQAPSIKSQKLYEYDENPAYSLPGKPTVTTTEGKTIELDLLFEIPKAEKGIYRYGNELYTYDMNTYTITHIENGDAASFETIASSFSFDQYAKDKNNVYCGGEVLVGADVKTFREIPDWFENQTKYLTPTGGNIVYEDKNSQYVYAECTPIKPTN